MPEITICPSEKWVSLSQIKFYVYSLNEKYGCFVVKAIFNNRQQAEYEASQSCGFVEEVFEQIEE